ncbi:MAG: hypothetical protein WBB01_26605 [Phormidesmis sp.]
MAVLSKIRSVNAGINAWFTQPEDNAAGSMGLFRILYAIFYLWHLSVHSSDFLSGMPSFFVEERVYLVKYFFSDFGASFSPLFFYTLDSLLVAALVLLAFGYKTRMATAAVLIIGGLLEALSASVDGKRTLLPMVFYIPFFMTVLNAWGQTYSVDAALKKRKSGVQVDPHDSNWAYFLPARAVLVVFSFLFFVSGVYKVAFGGAWLSHADMMANFFLNRNVEAAVYDLPLNWLAPYIAQAPLIYLSIHVTTLLFEGFFFLSMINRKVRDFFVSLALIFHAVNALWVVVTVTPILIGYGIFIDWQAIKDSLLPQKESQAVAEGRSPKRWVLLALFSATVLGLLWHSDLGIRAWLNLNGLINWRTVWYPVLPISIWWFVVTIVRFRRPVKTLSL